jgi:hypothetical protein
MFVFGLPLYIYILFSITGITLPPVNWGIEKYRLWKQRQIAPTPAPTPSTVDNGGQTNPVLSNNVNDVLRDKLVMIKPERPDPIKVLEN